jgi:hypothetical protein
MRYVVALLGVVGLFVAAGLLKSYVIEPHIVREKQRAAGIEIRPDPSHLTVRWTKLEGYAEGVTLRLPREYKSGASPTTHHVSLELRFDQLEAWKTPPPFPPDMVAEIRQGHRTADQANVVRERVRRFKLVQLGPATRLLQARRRFIEEAPQLLAGAYMDQESRWNRKRPRWPDGASPYGLQPDGMRAGLQRFSRRQCMEPHQLEGRPDLAEALRELKERGELMPGNCYLDRLNAVYVSPGDTPAEKWTTLVCHPWGRTCTVHFIAAGVAAELSIWEADVEVLEQYTGTVRAALVPWVTAKPLP